LRRSYIAKGLISAFLVVLAFAFGGLLTRKDSAGGERILVWLIIHLTNRVAVIEWVIGFLFNFYLLTFWYDLRQAAPKHDEHEELKRQQEAGLRV
jgi:hypothetical protein